MMGGGHVCIRNALKWVVHILLERIPVVNMKLDIDGCNKIKFHGCRLHWCSFFLMTQHK